MTPTERKEQALYEARILVVTRAARGLKADRCGQCRTGWVPGTSKLFDPHCAGCLEKLATGARTGNEPRPTHRGGEKWVDHARVAKQNKARLRAMAALPSPRGAR
jgi:hypothetical protein